MTVPIWSPFALLVVVCALPLDRLRRLDWLNIAVYLAVVVYCLAAWAAVGLAVWWLVW